jgi:hypothetical protein
VQSPLDPVQARTLAIERHLKTRVCLVEGYQIPANAIKPDLYRAEADREIVHALPEAIDLIIDPPKIA